MRVSVAKSARTFSVERDQSVLDAARRAGLNLPHSCRSGNCGSCRARLIRGEVRYPNGPPLGLSAAEIADGLVLLCQARPASDLTIETFEPAAAGELAVKDLPCRIERIVPLAHDVVAVYLKLPVAERFDFEPGQYIDVLLSGGRRRSFSIASPPHDSRLLELHVRLAPGGEFTEPLFSGRMTGALLRIEGPLGQFIYREPATSRESAGEHEPGGEPPPLLLIGGGTGLAPLMSILRHVTEAGRPRDVTLYWGVRAERDLYARAALERLAVREPRFRYLPVLSEPSTAWRGLVGPVHEAVLAGVADLARHDIHASGPPGMIEAVRREFAARGVDPSRLAVDSFDYAPDTLERQRTAAATKS